LSNLSEALVAFVPSVSIKDRPLHWTLVKSHISLSRAYTSGWGLGRLVILLSWVPTPSGPTEGGLYMGIRRSKHCERAGAWSPSMDRDSVLLTGGKWVGPVCTSVRAGRVFFRVPSWAH
jgi:hypothetical protein